MTDTRSFEGYDVGNRPFDVALGLASPAAAASLRGLGSPAVAEILGSRIADELRALDVGTVVTLNSLESVVLAHVVARELDVDVASVDADMGVLQWGDALPPASRVALVDVRWVDYPGLEPLVRMVGNAGGTVVGVASVFPAPSIDLPSGVTVVCLDQRVASAP